MLGDDVKATQMVLRRGRKAGMHAGKDKEEDEDEENEEEGEGEGEGEGESATVGHICV